jgi:integrase
MSKLFMDERKIEALLRLSRPRPRDHAVFHMALATGFRAGDLLNLRRWDIATQLGVPSSIKIKMQKTGKMVERRLSIACRGAIERYLATRIDNNPFLFVSESNNSLGREEAMNRSSLHRLYKAYLGMIFSEEELKGNACHTTRRSVAKLISDKAGRIEPATRFLGHVSAANTAAYLDMDSYGRQADEIVQGMAWNQ